MTEEGGEKDNNWHQGLGKSPKPDSGHHILGEPPEKIKEIEKRNNPSVLGTYIIDKEPKHWGLGKSTKKNKP